jgi:hypothetical protein
MYTVSTIARSLFETYGEFRVGHVSPVSCVHKQLTDELGRIARDDANLVEQQVIGRSIEGRTIHVLRIGSGPRNIMLWSQMHGDEPTGTLAILDSVQFLIREHRLAWVAEMLRLLSIHLIPMLNPDGAEIRTRHNVVGIDINRDALTAVSPEAQALRNIHRKLNPEFGFNLHDQDLQSVGDTPRAAALALLAPPVDAQRSVPHARLKAMRLGALVSKALHPFVAGHIARYDDAYEPRAFGDLFQSLGTSTLLIESGHWSGDPEKRMIRKLNMVAILSGLWSIAGGTYEDAEMDMYTNLPLNGKRMFDLLIRGLEVRHAGNWTGTVDLGVMFERNSDRAIIKEIGDLSTHGGLETHSLGNRQLPEEFSRINTTVPRQVIFDRLNIYFGSNERRS